MSEERHGGQSNPLLRAMFGAFELDVRAGELRKHGVKIRLQEQPFRVLLMLLERPGEVVLREEIRKKLWPNDTIVEFAPSINAAIQRLRDALGGFGRSAALCGDGGEAGLSVHRRSNARRANS
jgi:DNA-binding winged helix-turn-helix (wHTH) protein